MDSLDFRNVFGKPVQYKELDIHPVKLIEANEFYDYVRCLLIPKNTFKEIEIIKMSYLKFLFYLGLKDGHPYLLESLLKLLTIVFKTENISFKTDEREKITLIIDEKNEINENDFDKIKKIICNQNLITIDDQILDPELEQKIKEAREFLQRKSGKMADLEQQIVAYHCAFKMKYDDIAELTIYQFQKGLSRMDLIKSADALQNAKYSGFVSVGENDKLPTWLTHIEESKDPNSDVLMSKGEFDAMASKNGLVG
ncbi:hypothetical protein [Metabacillus fastidiosus]|uniref:hypothetical protein n=1 Tax=Metabacillus fastidiosus TaxID=1458 RepID=UPI003D2823EE